MVEFYDRLIKFNDNLTFKIVKYSIAYTIREITATITTIEIHIRYYIYDDNKNIIKSLTSKS